MGELLDASNSASTMTTPPNDFAMLVKDLTTGQLKRVTTKDCIQIFPNKVYDSFIPTTCEFDKKASYAVVKKNKLGIKQVLKIRILAMRETMSEIHEIEGTIKNPVLAKQEILPFSTFKNAAEVKAIKARKEEQKVRKRGCSSDLSKEFLKKKKKTSEMESNNLETPKLGTITCKQPNGKPASKGKPDDVKETPQDLEEQIPTTIDPTGEILMNSPDSVHSSTVLLPAHTEETSNFNTPRKQHGMSNSTKDSDISPMESVIDETNNKKTEKPEEPDLSNLEKNSMNSKGNTSKETPENQTKEDEKSPTASICKRLDDIEESLQCLL